MDPFSLFIMGVSTLIGGAANVSSYLDNYNNAMEDAKDQIAEYERRRKEQLDRLNLNFEVAADEANKKADRQDERSTLTEMFTSENFNNQYDALKLQQKGQALAWNEQAIQDRSQMVTS